ncbi:hypothetical protein ACFL4G_01740 [Thermodesulfobacteriota bacterium]
MKKIVFTAMIVALALFTWVCGPASADEVTDQIDDAVKLYKDGKYAQAASELEFAVQQIRQKQAGLLKDIFPDPPSGWTAGESESMTTGAAFFGGGISASRSYSRDDSRIMINVVSNSPVIQSYLMMFSNPMMMAGQGDLVKVAGYKAIRKFDAGSGKGEMNIVVANKILVTIEGSRLADPQAITTFAEAMDFAGLESLANN